MICVLSSHWLNASACSNKLDYKKSSVMQYKA